AFFRAYRRVTLFPGDHFSANHFFLRQIQARIESQPFPPKLRIAVAGGRLDNGSDRSGAWIVFLGRADIFPDRAASGERNRRAGGRRSEERRVGKGWWSGSV